MSSTASAVVPPASFPASTSSTCSCRSTTPKHEERTRSPTSGCARSCPSSSSPCRTRSITTTPARSTSSCSVACSSATACAPLPTHWAMPRVRCSTAISQRSASRRGALVSGERRGRIEGLREPQRLSQQLSTLLAAEIVSGRIGVGEAFPSSEEIVSQYGVSRTVARETVQALAMLGMVNIQHGKRTEACSPESWDILSATVQEALRREGRAEPLLHDLYEFRLLIEPQAAACMAEHGAAKDLDDLGALVDRMESLIGSDASVDEVMETDRDFHNLIARSSENRVLAAVSRDIREVIGTLWGFSSLDRSATEHVAGQHRRIADAVIARDGRAAAAAMHEHLVWAAQADVQCGGEQAELRLPTASAAE